MARRAGRLLVAAVLGLPLLAPSPAAADIAQVGERTHEDTSVGYSILPIRGWEPKPRKNPDDPSARNDAGGWYSKKREEGAECSVLRFGSFFPESVAVPTEDTGPAEPGEGEPAGKDGPSGEGGEEPAPGGDDGAGGAGDGEGGGEAGGGKAGDGGGGADPGKPPEKKPAKPRGPRNVKDLLPPAPQSFEEWLELVRKYLNDSRQGALSLTSTPAKFGDDQGLLWDGYISQRNARKILMGATVRRGGFEVGVLYEAPDSKGFVRDYKGAFKASLKSLRILPDKTMRRARDALARKLAGTGGDAAFAEKVIAGLPKGWTHHKSDHYVIVYDKSIDTTTPGLVRRIATQLELLRAQVYEILFPAARPVTALSIVKVTQDPAQYMAYGAPEGSAGYWAWISRELVFFCKSDDYNLTLDVLNHEAFHQYIFYAVGQVAPHSWFNEGHGDYFAGFNLVEGKFKPGKFHWRQKKIQRAIETGSHVPLKEFLKFSQAEYYRRGGNARKGEDVGQNYAQGWSLVYFLRTTKDPAYVPILERYFDALKAGVSRWRQEEEALAKKEGRPPDELMPPETNQKIMDDALAAGFQGIDLDKLEKDWIASKPY